MEFVSPSVTPIITGGSTPQEMIKVIEGAYRICYKSEHLMKEGSEKLVERLLKFDDPKQNIHSSPLEHRRITMSCKFWVMNAIDVWQYNHKRAFISIYRQKTHDAEENEGILEGNLRAFFDFVKEIRPYSEEDITNDSTRINEARLVINEELHKFFPLIFQYTYPWDTYFNDRSVNKYIDWGGVCYIGEASEYMTFKIITSRDMLQEIARHRTLSPNVESTRYCNYNKRGMSICCPLPYDWAKDLLKNNGSEFDPNKTPRIALEIPEDIASLYRLATRVSELCYNKAISLGAKPQEARGLLLGCLKTEILLTGTYTAWGHFVRLRNDKAADPQMQYIAKFIEEWFNDHGVNIREY